MLPAFRFGLVAAFLSFTVSLSALADVWTDADNLFKQREGNRAKIQEARDLYVAILPTVTGQQLIRAVSQLGRLAIYEGVMVLPLSAKAERKRVFRDCWENFAEKIKPAVVGENPAYYYFKGVCLAYWGEAAGTLASLPHVPTIVNMINRGMEGDTRFEGGGIYRLAAGVYSNIKAQPLGLYKPKEALLLIDKSLASAAFPGDPHSGNAYFDNWRGKALVLVELQRHAEAKQLLEAKIAEIEELEAEEELPRGREAETLWNLSAMKEQLQAIND
jgi:hypothetical protein